MLIPPYLKAGDTIALAAPARFVTPDKIAPTVQLFKNEGFNLIYTPELFTRERQFAGSDALRAADFQAHLNDPDVNAILCVRGGYGTIRLLDSLDFTLLQQFPKWICGYSDITVLHAHIHTQYHMATLHCTMPLNITASKFQSEALRTLLRALRGEKLEYVIENHKLNRKGEAEGLLVGGNLSILYSLLESSASLDTVNKILLIEDVGEYLYHIDRMLISLKRAGKLQNIKGLIVGGFSDMNDNAVPYGQTAEEIIAEQCADYDFPMVFGAPVGHIDDNRAFRLGTVYKVRVSDNQVIIT
ncbi:MAG: LD-carboxypeptidase [Bacteroidales bacterium]|jgi:muramoyltetrapeptide carboxypeptidase|nr:LD-carboxypeptidase [Bacteroidales bacterium]